MLFHAVEGTTLIEQIIYIALKSRELSDYICSRLYAKVGAKKALEVLGYKLSIYAEFRFCFPIPQPPHTSATGCSGKTFH